MNIIYLVTGKWVYPVMNSMGPLMRVVFIASLLLCSCGMYFVGHWINNWIWGEDLTPHYASFLPSLNINTQTANRRRK